VVAKSIALSIDGGHLRAARQYQGRTFEVLLAQVSNNEGKRVVFASVPAEATSQTRQLRGVLHGLGATPATLATILSDGADGPRSLGEAASPGPTHHVLDWFHLAMRVQHVAQAATSSPDTTETDRNTGARLTETIERIRWRLWHGQVKRALDLIAETIVTVTVDVAAEDMSATATVARKPGHHRAGRHVENAGRFGVTQVFHRYVQQDAALIVWKVVHRSQDIVLPQPVLLRGGRADIRFLRVFQGQHMATPRSLTKPVDGQVMEGPEQPGPRVSIRSTLMPPIDGVFQCILNKVIGGCGILEERASIAPQRWNERLDHCAIKPRSVPDALQLQPA
jgi:hypothetical protein